ncbi:hypothetical protein F0L74_22745 [Chitinophaga agrisoli]|uniref:Uncharacterized protein n=1 Tax=Chitinophaga agrisoli TaxID=2607653 RepID=A0A5B2VHI3_9BACT|nr:hypothetical protein [Chitinophaga agrisoli]KAA2239033.1 hypothetical protein F0L74_22745 [Chitinophaga agrisoli]
MIRMFLLTICMVISQAAFSQRTTDGIFLFKSWFFMEHVNANYRTQNVFPSKDASLFASYQKNMFIKCDTLRSQGFEEEYVFLSVPGIENKKSWSDSTIVYGKTRETDYMLTPTGNCEGYVLCVNTDNGKSYRLRGFLGNDFMSLLRDVRKEYEEAEHKPLSARAFLKNHGVESLDLYCIYHGLKRGKDDTDVYPCLKRCSYYTVIIH